METEKEMIAHLVGYEERKKLALAREVNLDNRLDDIEATIKTGLIHPKSAEKTIAMIESLRETVQLHIDTEDKYKQDVLIPFFKTQTQYENFKTVGEKIFQKVIYFLIGFGVIFGSIVGFKEWIKK